MPKVKNLNGTASRACNCDSWLTHWDNYTALPFDSAIFGCAASTCTNNAEVGAHVKITSYDDHNEYIIPLCSSCNQLTEEFTVNRLTDLVSANLEKTCGR